MTVLTLRNTGQWIVTTLLTVLILGGCTTTPPLGPNGVLTDELIRQFNDAARQAVSRPKARAPSGSRKPRDIARSAVLEYDRNHVHLFSSKIRQLNFDYFHRYIEAQDWHRLHQQLFVERGVVPNFRYRSRNDDYLLKLEGRYRLSQSAADILSQLHEPWMSEHSIELPAIQILVDTDPGRGKNYHSHGLTVIDPPALRRQALRMDIDADEVIEAVAVHEAAHAIHTKIIGRNRNSVFKGKLEEISEAAGNRVQFRHYREVIEILADAVEIQLGSTALRYVASRIVRGGRRLGSTHVANNKTKRKILRYPHDASALFLQSLIREEQKRLKITDKEKKIGWLRQQGRANARRSRARLPSLIWFHETWNPALDEIMQPEFEQRIRDEYAKFLRKTLSVLAPIS